MFAPAAPLALLAGEPRGDDGPALSGSFPLLVLPFRPAAEKKRRKVQSISPMIWLPFQYPYLSARDYVIRYDYELLCYPHRHLEDGSNPK